MNIKTVLILAVIVIVGAVAVVAMQHEPSTYDSMENKAAEGYEEMKDEARDA